MFGYYELRISIFVSVDPLAPPAMTPYQYVSNNPIMRFDHTTMNYDDLILYGATSAKVQRFLKSIQYLSSSFRAFSSLTASDQESFIKYSQGLKRIQYLL